MLITNDGTYIGENVDASTLDALYVAKVLSQLIDQWYYHSLIFYELSTNYICE